MAKLVFEGDLKTLETIQKENRLRVKRKGLKVSLTESKEAKQIEVKEPQEVKPKSKSKTSKKK